MDQTEQQEEYHQQNTEGNESWKNKVEIFTEKCHGMEVEYLDKPDIRPGCSSKGRQA